MRITREQMDFIRLHLNDRPRSKYIAMSGVSRRTFYRAVRELNGELRHELAVARPGIKECVVRYFPTMSANEIHERFGYAKTPILRWAERLGVKSSPEKIERLRDKNRMVLQEGRKTIDRAARAAKWKARRRLDEYRAWQGLPRKTKFRLKTMPYRSWRAKWYLCKAYGYRMAENPYVLEVTDGTRRCGNEAYFEKRYKLTFVEITENKDSNNDLNKE